MEFKFVVCKTRNHPEPPRTTQNDREPARTSLQRVGHNLDPKNGSQAIVDPHKTTFFFSQAITHYFCSKLSVATQMPILIDYVKRILALVNLNSHWWSPTSLPNFWRFVWGGVSGIHHILALYLLFFSEGAKRMLTAEIHIECDTHCRGLKVRTLRYGR